MMAVFSQEQSLSAAFVYRVHAYNACLDALKLDVRFQPDLTSSGIWPEGTSAGGNMVISLGLLGRLTCCFGAYQHMNTHLSRHVLRIILTLGAMGRTM